jgi:hypothetical protein
MTRREFKPKRLKPILQSEVDRDTYDAVVAAAKADDRTISALVRRIVCEWLARNQVSTAA